MSNIKSYTDIFQSKKLAEILSSESADMYYFRQIDNDYIPPDIESIRPIPQFKDGKEDFNYDIRCWSLTALLDVIPQEIFDGEYVINITEGCDNRWVLTYDYYGNRNHSYYGLSTSADNLINACYEIILKFKERNII